MTLTLHSLHQALEAAPDCQRFVVGLSGGVDSVVLLHGLLQQRDAGLIKQSVAAIHINHGIQDAANDWQSFCEVLCERWQVPLQTRLVELRAGSSLEDAARESRYQAFSELLTAQSVLLLAHHQDDQLETLMLRLLRGAGPAGLQGMPRQRDLAGGTLFRSLLDFTRRQVVDYAQQENLQWVVDSSNSELQHDRNYLRQQVLPLLEQRWPAYRESWGKSLTLLAEAAQMLREVAEQDLREMSNDQGRLRVPALCNLSTARQRQLLRYWLQQLGLAEPGWNQLQQLVEQVLVQEEGGGNLQLADCCVQVYNNELYALRDLPAIEGNGFEKIDIQPQARLLPGNGYLDFQQLQGQGLSPHCNELELRYRQGGESISLPGRPNKTLKKLFQESVIPPWLRDRIPLLFHHGELICVPGLGIAETALAGATEQGYEVCWQPPEFEFSANLVHQSLLRAPIINNPD